MFAEVGVELTPVFGLPGNPVAAIVASNFLPNQFLANAGPSNSGSHQIFWGRWRRISAPTRQQGALRPLQGHDDATAFDGDSWRADKAPDTAPRVTRLIKRIGRAPCDGDGASRAITSKCSCSTWTSSQAIYVALFAKATG